MRRAGVGVYKMLPIGVRRALFFGRARRCPVCDSRVRAFLPGGVNVILLDARCPVCGSESRHRLAMVLIRSELNRRSGQRVRMMDVGPSPCMERSLRATAGLEYTVIDLSATPGRIRADITALPFEDESFDIVRCSHVLEHVVDDRRGMKELFRVLTAGGQAVIQVPITVPETFEDPEITDPLERKAVFGQVDHVRRYGPDVVERLEGAGFSVAKVTPLELVPDDVRTLLAIREDEELYACTKRASEPGASKEEASGGSRQ